MILKLISYYSIYFVFLFSVVGYGFIFNYLFRNAIYSKNLGYLIIFGSFFLSFLSYLSILFISHNEHFNLLIHLLGVLSFLFNIKKIKLNSIILIFLSVLFLSMILSKNHDDFPYYHLQQVLNLTQNKLIIGLGNLETSYSHHSSILFLNSLFYIPFYKFYFFNEPNMILYSGLSLIFIEHIFKKNLNKFLRIFSLFIVTYFLSKFNRLSEFGTDIIGQYIILIFIFEILKYFFISKKRKPIFFNKNSILLISCLVFCISIKTYFVIYSLFVILIFFMIDLSKLFQLVRKKFFFFIFIILYLSLYLGINLATSGCLIYPFPNLCFENLSWALKIKEIIDINAWYEIWAKSLAGPSFRVENNLELIKNFEWIKYWIDNYFFYKFTDNIAGLFFLSFIILIASLFIKNKNPRERARNIELKYFLIILLILIVVWFFNFPQLRYGGYALFITLFAYFNSILLSSYSYGEKRFNRLMQTLLILSLAIFCLKNMIRISNELKREDMYKFNNFPFFTVPSNIEYNEKNVNGLIKLYTPVNNNCWYIPSPCPGGSDDINAKLKFGFIILYNENR